MNNHTCHDESRQRHVRCEACGEHSEQAARLISAVVAPDLGDFDPIRSLESARVVAAINKTRLSYWFPLIRDAGLPVPRTEIVSSTIEEEAAIWRAFDGDAVDFSALEQRTRDAALRLGGAPVFLRTDLTSAKHDWKCSCFVDDLATIGRHLYVIAEFSACADFFGMPFDVWVVREMLKTSPAFTAFWGDMPITREFRFFVRDGVIEHTQPYWPRESIDGHTNDPQWQEKLTAISALTSDERASLEALTLQASAAVPGFWSVDWLWTVDRGWVLTDMAEGDKSFSWEPSKELI